MGKILKALEKVKEKEKTKKVRLNTEREKAFAKKNQALQKKTDKDRKTVFSIINEQNFECKLDSNKQNGKNLHGGWPIQDVKSDTRMYEESIDKYEIVSRLQKSRKECNQFSFRKKGTQTNYFLNKQQNNLFTLNKPNSIISEHFKIARTLVSNVIREKKLKTILITSSLPFEGKSFVASNIAVSLAQGLDKHVLLVDTDLNHPSLHNIFQIQSNKGLSDFLVDDKYQLKDLIKKTEIPKLSLLPAGSCFEYADELFSSELMTLFIQEVKYRYDNRVIIFDSSPTIISHSLAISDKVDGCIIIVKSGKTNRKLVSKAIEMIGKNKVIGIIMNYCEISSKNYAGYYGNNDFR